MPIYDYLCSNCGTRTEVIHGIDAPGPRFCPACGAEGTLRKQFVPPTVHFKGSGWAKKDRSSSSGVRSKRSSDSGSSDSSDGAKGGDGAGSGASGSDATGGTSSEAGKGKAPTGSSGSGAGED